MTIDYDITTRVAAVQSEPVWFDGDATVDKACRIIDDAAANGAKVIGFPEVYVSGYPWWLWINSPWQAGRFTRSYYASSMGLADARMRQIMDAARRNGIFVVMGYSELAGGTLYISQVFIDDSGEIVANRRKLKPTHVERTLFGEGDGSDLFVADTAVGRIGGLNCWEHYQALTIFTMTALHEQIHVASWPSNDIFQPAYNQTIDADRNMTSVYAALTQSFVICSTQVIGPSAQVAWELDESEKDKLPVGGGWAGIYGPDGDELTRADRLAPDAEGILYADIDLNDIVGVKSHLDPVGHYSRPDVFNLHINTKGNSLVRYSGDGSRRVPVTGDGAITVGAGDAQGEGPLGGTVVHADDHASESGRHGADE